MPDFSAWTSNDWTALGTVVYAIAAILTLIAVATAAVYAGRQVREVRRTREEQARPFVVVDIQPSSVSMQILNLVIENIGATVAHDVTFEFDPPIQSTRREYPLAESALLRDGIPSFPPRRRIAVLFDTARERKSSGLPMRYDVVVRFRDSRQREQEPLRYVIDLSPLYGLMRVDEYGIHHAAKAIREIETMLRQSRRGGRLAFWVRSEDAAIEEENVEEAMTGEYPSLGRKPPPEIVMALGRSVIVRSTVRAVRQWRTRRSQSGG